MPDEPTIKRLIRKGTIDMKFVPMICGTAFKNKGVQTLLDAVIDYLPSPLDIPDVQVGVGGVMLSNGSITSVRVPGRTHCTYQAPFVA